MRAALYRPPRSPDCQHIDVLIRDLTIAGCRMLCPVDLDEGGQWMIDLPGLGTRSCRIGRSHRQGIRCEFQDPLDFTQIEKSRAAHRASGGTVPWAFPSDPARPREIGDRRFPRVKRLELIILAAIGAWLLFYGIVGFGKVLLASSLKAVGM